MGAAPKFAPGFRLSVFDVMILTAGIGSAAGLGKEYWPASLIVLTVVGHFFLFCNVFRISRRPELLWAGVFTLLAGATTVTGFPGWMISISATALSTQRRISFISSSPVVVESLQLPAPSSRARLA